MRADALAYTRAASVCLFGLVTQIVLSLVLFAYAVFTRDSLAASAGWLTIVGVPAWLGLLMVFHQHKLERREAEEAEAYAGSTAAQASVFQDAADELRVAAKRLVWMHTVLLPTLSLLIAVLLLYFGWTRLSDARAIDPSNMDVRGSTGWAVALGLGVGVIGFVFARFVAGMAQQRVWQNLRAGAVYSVGASIAGLAVAVGQGVAYLGSDRVYLLLSYALPVLMLITGTEAVLNFILNIYRPRHAGEYPRPAFESRILGFISAPDRIAESISDAVNYQFGWNVSTSWFYQLLSRSAVGLASLALLLLWLLTSLAVVKPNERGLVLRHGEIARAVESGLHLKRPWPLESLETYPALEVNQLVVGAAGHEHHDGEDANKPILWTEAHGAEPLTIIQPVTTGAASGDVALVVLEVVVQYEIDDLEAYMRLAADSTNRDDPDAMRRELLRVEASRVVLDFASSLTINQLLGPEREALNTRLLARLRAAYAALGDRDGTTGTTRGTGVRLLFAGIANAHPPATEGVAGSFVAVVSAEQEREALIEIARRDAIQILATVAGDPVLARDINAHIRGLESLREADAAPGQIAEKEAEIQGLLESAGGDAAVLIASARSDRWRRHMEARGRAVRHRGRVDLFRAAPAPYMAQQYLAAIAEAVSEARLFVTAFADPKVRYNFEEAESNLADPFKVNELDDF